MLLTPKEDMSQKDYQIGVARRRLQRLRLGFYAALHTDVITLLKYQAYRTFQHSRSDARKIKIRSLQTSSAKFSVNAYSELDAMTQFRFPPKETCFVTSITRCHARLTPRSRYQWDTVTACCIVLMKLAAPCRLHDLEACFGMQASKMG